MNESQDWNQRSDTEFLEKLGLICDHRPGRAQALNVNEIKV